MKRYRNRVSLFFSIALPGLMMMTSPLHAQKPPLPSGPLPEGLGVNIHFTDPQPGEMKMMAEAGIRWVRMDLFWDQTEREKGVYDFSAYDRLIKALEEHRIRPIFILDYVNKFYDNAQSPHTPEGRAGMARWAAAAASHFRGRGVLWEMYNEPNIFPFWRPKPNVQDYILLAKEVGEAIQRAAPGEVYIGPATSGVDLRFIEACFQGGLLNYWKAVSVHPYRSQDPETVEEDYRRLRQLIQRYAPGKKIPIISGEWGYSAIWSGMDPQRQGKLLPRQWLTNIANEVILSIWYDWRDDGLDPKEPEHHFGTVRHSFRAAEAQPFEPKPAYLAAKTLTTFLNGFQFNKRLSIGDGRDYVLLFTRGSETRLVAWTRSTKSHTDYIPVSPGKFQVFNHLGERLPDIQADPSGLPITLTDAPHYLIPEKPNELLLLAASAERAPLEIVIRNYEALRERRFVRPETPRIRQGLKLKNPLKRTLKIQTESQTVMLRPGATATLFSSASVMRSPVQSPLNFEWSIEGVGTLRQRSHVVVEDYVTLTLLPPAGDDLLVRLDNPSKKAFQGRLALYSGGAGAGIYKTVDIPSGQESSLIRFPGLFKNGKLDNLACVLSYDDRTEILRESFSSIVVIDSFRRSSGDSPLTDYRLLPDGDSKVASDQSLSAECPPEGPPIEGMHCLKLQYRFDPGWKFVRMTPERESLRKIEGRPKALGLWIYGDGQGNSPRLRIVDSTGQTFQPESDPIDWKGWRYVLFPLDGSRGGHWGGANDGVIHYPIRFDTLFLLDSPGGKATQGAIYISSPTLIR
jgi:hypothetical protein